jgi:hypothetical protein
MRTTSYDECDDYSVRKRGRSGFRRSTRDAALAIADFWGAVADTTAEILVSSADGIATVCDTTAGSLRSEGTRLRSSESHADALAAAARYFDEMSKISREAEARERQIQESAQQIDYERLAKAVVAEMNRAKNQPNEIK